MVYLLIFRYIRKRDARHGIAGKAQHVGGRTLDTYLPPTAELFPV
jgi:hypothetical protein